MLRAASKLTASLSLILKNQIGLNSSRSSFCNMANERFVKSFSKISHEKFRHIKGVDIQYIPREDSNDLFPVNRPIPECLWDGLHKALGKLSNAYGPPKRPSNEAKASARVEQVLIQALTTLQIENKMDPASGDISIEPQYDLAQLVKDPDVGGGNMDFVVVLQPKHARRIREAVMVEVKKHSPEVALPQLLLAQERMFKTNHDQRPVYGFATNGYEWILAVFDGNQEEEEKKYRLSKDMCLFDKFEEESEWKKGQAATILKLVYGVLASELEYSYDVPHRSEIEILEAMVLEMEKNREAEVLKMDKNLAETKLVLQKLREKKQLKKQPKK